MEVKKDRRRRSARDKRERKFIWIGDIHISKSEKRGLKPRKKAKRREMCVSLSRERSSYLGKRGSHWRQIVRKLSGFLLFLFLYFFHSSERETKHHVHRHITSSRSRKQASKQVRFVCVCPSDLGGAELIEVMIYWNFRTFFRQLGHSHLLRTRTRRRGITFCGARQNKKTNTKSHLFLIFWASDNFSHRKGLLIGGNFPRLASSIWSWVMAIKSEFENFCLVWERKKKTFREKLGFAQPSRNQPANQDNWLKLH